jgi:hypothetical protein
VLHARGAIEEAPTDLPMPSKRDAVIVAIAVATAMVAFEDRQWAEIRPTQIAEPAVAGAAENGCAAAVEYQKYLIRRTTLMAFGIAVPDRRDEGRRLIGAAASCDP